MKSNSDYNEKACARYLIIKELCDQYKLVWAGYLKITHVSQFNPFRYQPLWYPHWCLDHRFSHKWELVIVRFDKLVACFCQAYYSLLLGFIAFYCSLLAMFVTCWCLLPTAIIVVALLPSTNCPHSLFVVVCCSLLLIVHYGFWVVADIFPFPSLGVQVWGPWSICQAPTQVFKKSHFKKCLFKKNIVIFFSKFCLSTFFLCVFMNSENYYNWSVNQIFEETYIISKLNFSY